MPTPATESKTPADHPGYPMYRGEPTVGLEEVLVRDPALRAWFDGEVAQRRAEYAEWESRDVEISGGVLTVGGWYDVGAREGWGSRQRVKFWRNCRYLGRTPTGGYSFERWGATPSGGAKDNLSAENLSSVGPIEPSAKLQAAAKRKREEDERWAEIRAATLR